MQFICDAPPGKTWFRIETEAEAGFESTAMSHAVEKYFRQAYEQAVASYVPSKSVRSIEASICCGSNCVGVVVGTMKARPSIVNSG